jgi:hypothetical protein
LHIICPGYGGFGLNMRKQLLLLPFGNFRQTLDRLSPIGVPINGQRNFNLYPAETAPYFLPLK